ncbi:MAG: ATP-dependent DNA helicase RecG [Sulfurospirillum sp.]|nr:ATP-dependent DNA helicase RecG [Sulfurospirillum sp.]
MTKLKKLGVTNLIDLALLLPKSYENTFLTQTPVVGEKNTVLVTVSRVNWTPKALSLWFFVDTWGEYMSGVVFQAKAYHRAIFRVGEQMYISAILQSQNAKLSLMQPIVVQEINKITPKYKTSLQNKTVVALMHEYLSIDKLMAEGLNGHEAELLCSLHFPTPQVAQKYSRTLEGEALRIVKFVEIFNYLKILQKKKRFFAPKHMLTGDAEPFVNSLPFKLTSDQKNAIADIKKDFSSKKAARRIIMGDVGSGKTMVILASVLLCYPQRSILMAPTTILANQIFSEAKRFLPLHVRVALVTNSTSNKLDLNDFDFIIGTHALLYRSLPQLDLIMIDEQHRFGIAQRELINQLSIKEDHYSHFLQFTATPIPRTMSMIQSELIDFSFIKQTPFEKDIDTRIIHKQDFKNLIDHIKAELSLHRQTIVIYPLVNESENIAYQSIEEGRGFWEKNFEKVFVTYGADKNKEEILERFREEGNILIATTLVEVGISLPRLSTLVIVGAERLGLASLHQLRGRVSRNGLKGYCFLYTNQKEPKRLEDFSTCKDGFEIAELDLRCRKSGDVLGGSKQSGEKFVYYGLEEDILTQAKQRLEGLALRDC